MYQIEYILINRVIYCDDMGCRNIKTVKGRQYLYYVVSNGTGKKALYCGAVNKKESTQKALKFEIIELKDRKKKIVRRICEREQELQKIK